MWKSNGGKKAFPFPPVVRSTSLWTYKYKTCTYMYKAKFFCFFRFFYIPASFICLVHLVGGAGVMAPPRLTPYGGQPQECKSPSGSCKVLTRRSASVYTHVALLSQLHHSSSPSSPHLIFLFTPVPPAASFSLLFLFSARRSTTVS